MTLPTSQVLGHVEYWMQKARCSQCQSVYTLAARLGEKAEQLRSYRYGGDDWVQEQADVMKEEVGMLLRRLIELLAEQDEEAMQFCSRVRELRRYEALLREESAGTQGFRAYYRYLAAYVHQSAERLDLNKELFDAVSSIVEERPE